jgi:hypothetical protein
VWAKNHVKWTSDLVEPDDKLIELLKSPEEALNYFTADIKRPDGASDIDWANHMFTVTIIILDLCCFEPY